MFGSLCIAFMQRWAMELRRQLRQGNRADKKRPVPCTIPAEDEHFRGGAPWDENTCYLPEHYKDDWLQEGSTPFGLSQAEADRGGAEVAWAIPGLQPLVPSRSTGLLERTPLRTDSGQTASDAAPIKASLELLVPVHELLFVVKCQCV